MSSKQYNNLIDEDDDDDESSSTAVVISSKSSEVVDQQVMIKQQAVLVETLSNQISTMGIMLTNAIQKMHETNKETQAQNKEMMKMMMTMFHQQQEQKQDKVISSLTKKVNDNLSDDEVEEKRCVMISRMLFNYFLLVGPNTLADTQLICPFRPYRDEKTNKIFVMINPTLLSVIHQMSNMYTSHAKEVSKLWDEKGCVNKSKNIPATTSSETFQKLWKVDYTILYSSNEKKISEQDKTINKNYYNSFGMPPLNKKIFCIPLDVFIEKLLEEKQSLDNPLLRIVEDDKVVERVIEKKRHLPQIGQSYLKVTSLEHHVTSDRKITEKKIMRHKACFFEKVPWSKEILNHSDFREMLTKIFQKVFGIEYTGQHILLRWRIASSKKVQPSIDIMNSLFLSEHKKNFDEYIQSNYVVTNQMATRGRTKKGQDDILIVDNLLSPGKRRKRKTKVDAEVDTETGSVSYPPETQNKKKLRKVSSSSVEQKDDLIIAVNSLSHTNTITPLSPEQKKMLQKAPGGGKVRFLAEMSKTSLEQKMKQNIEEDQQHQEEEEEQKLQHKIPTGGKDKSPYYQQMAREMMESEKSNDEPEEEPINYDCDVDIPFDIIPSGGDKK